MFSDNGFPVLDRDIVSLRFQLEWDAEALKALIAYAVETCLASGEDCSDVVDRRLFGARPFRYGHWCIQKALAAGEPETASFYLRELVDCVRDGRRASGLTVEGARAGLAGDEALLSQFDKIFERVVGSKSRPEDGRSAESTDEVGPRLLHQAAERYLGNVGSPAGRMPRERLTDLRRRLVGIGGFPARGTGRDDLAGGLAGLR